MDGYDFDAERVICDAMAATSMTKAASWIFTGAKLIRDTPELGTQKIQQTITEPMTQAKSKKPDTVCD